MILGHLLSTINVYSCDHHLARISLIPFSRAQFTLSRYYLLCCLTLATGTRPGALNNVLLSDYQTSRVSEGKRIILVPKHKQTKDGPAMLGMELLMQKMATYVTKIRPAFANPNEDKLFVKDDYFFTVVIPITWVSLAKDMTCMTDFQLNCLDSSECHSKSSKEGSCLLHKSTTTWPVKTKCVVKKIEKGNSLNIYLANILSTLFPLKKKNVTTLNWINITIALF